MVQLDTPLFTFQGKPSQPPPQAQTQAPAQPNAFAPAAAPGVFPQQHQQAPHYPQPGFESSAPAPLTSNEALGLRERRRVAGEFLSLEWPSASSVVPCVWDQDR